MVNMKYVMELGIKTIECLDTISDFESCGNFEYRIFERIGDLSSSSVANHYFNEAIRATLLRVKKKLEIDGSCFELKEFNDELDEAMYQLIKEYMWSGYGDWLQEHDSDDSENTYAELKLSCE